MKIKKLNNNFKLYQYGRAILMAEMTPEEFVKARRFMTEAYGQGQSVHHDASGDQRHDWFYKFHTPKAKPGTTGYGLDGHRYRSDGVDSFRIFMRREEQAIMLTLAMS